MAEATFVQGLRGAGVISVLFLTAGCVAVWLKSESDTEARSLQSLPRLMSGQSLEVTPELMETHESACGKQNTGRDVLFQLGQQKYVYTCPSVK